MKDEIINILNQHKINPTETWLTSDVILEEDFYIIADKIINLLDK